MKLDTQTVLKLYPIRNSAWCFVEGTESFVADVAELPKTAEGLLLDPWNRPMPTHSIKIERNDDGDILTWICLTTVLGFPMTLKVFND